MEFGFSAPVYRGGHLAGVLVASFNVGSTLRAAAPAAGGLRSAVLGPRDIDRGRLVMPSDFTFLAHPLLQSGQVRALTSTTSQLLTEKFGSAAPAGKQFVMTYAKPELLPDYVDPLDTNGSRWTAAFAPIGKTGYVLAIQAGRAAPGLGLLLALCLGLILLLWALSGLRVNHRT